MSELGCKKGLDMSLISGANVLEASDCLVLKMYRPIMYCTCPLESGVNHGRQPTYLNYMYIFFI